MNCANYRSIRGTISRKAKVFDISAQRHRISIRVLAWGAMRAALVAVDADGVALAAAQGLQMLLEEKEAQLDALEEQNEELQDRVQVLEEKVEYLLNIFNSVADPVE